MDKNIVLIAFKQFELAYELLYRYVHDDYEDSLKLLREAIQHLKDGMLEE